MHEGNPVDLPKDKPWDEGGLRTFKGSSETQGCRAGVQVGRWRAQNKTDTAWSPHSMLYGNMVGKFLVPSVLQKLS